MKKVLIYSFTILAAFAIGCDKKKGGTPATTPTTTTTTTGIGNCYPGQVYNTTHGCLDQGGCANGQGRVPNNGSSQAGQCVSGTVVTANDVYGNTNFRFGKSLAITDRNTFEQLMKEYGGFCDPPNFFYWTIGPNPYDCDSYSSAGYIIIQTNSASPSQVSITVGAGADSPTGNSYYGWYSSNLLYNMQFNAEYYDINSSEGFELRSSGLFGTRSWNAVYSNSFRVKAEDGRLSEDSFYVDLYYKGTRFARALVERY